MPQNYTFRRVDGNDSWIPVRYERFQTMISLQKPDCDRFEQYFQQSANSYSKLLKQQLNLEEETAVRWGQEECERVKASPGHEIWELTRDGSPVGFIQIRITQGLEDCYLLYIEIPDEFRGQGIGRQAMKELREMAASRGLKRIRLHAFLDNEHARSLYRSEGFRETGVNMLLEL